MSRGWWRESKARASSSWFARLRRRILGWVGGPVGRVEWCRAQRHSLRDPARLVVWVHRESMPWALWGARRGYFELERMDGLAYLRARRAG
jgi:hypothetical protein